MTIYTTHYQAIKARETDRVYSTADKIVKVDGGYIIMTASDYNTWRKQK